MKEGNVGPMVRKSTQLEGEGAEDLEIEQTVSDPVPDTGDVETAIAEVPSPAAAVEETPLEQESPAVSEERAPAPVPSQSGGLENPAARRRVVDVASQGEAPIVPRSTKVSPKPAIDEAEYEGLESDFAAMVEGTLSRANRQMEPGDTVKGRVVLLGDDHVFVDLSDKTEGYLPRSQVMGDDGELTVGLGDTVEAYFVKRSASGVELAITLGGGGGGGSEEELRSAWAARLPVEGKVLASNKGGYEVSVFGQRAFCPISQIELDYTEDADAHLNKSYRFLITKVEGGGKKCNVVVSRAELLREERAGLAAATLASLQEGAVISGPVRRIAPFGAFVDLGGIDGLVHVSEMSWGRSVDPSDVVSVGQIVQVEVLSVQIADDPSKTRVSLSMKAASASPWETIGESFVVGGLYSGTVVRVQPFGAFVELSPGLDGLVHISELSQRRIGHPKEVVEIGQVVQVQVLSIDPLKQRIGLSMKALAADPWNGVTERYPAGKTVSGVVENVEDFGVFIELEPGLTALLPMSEMPRGNSPRRRFRTGDTVEASVLGVDVGRRRLSLTVLSADERSERNLSRGGQPAPQDFDQPKQEQGMGTLGDLFAAKLRGRK
jgi:small subunit ribosomal protein S1